MSSVHVVVMEESRFPNPGEEFHGRYQIEGLIGQGGFSRVYRARQRGLERSVALKVLDPEINAAGRSRSEVEEKKKLIARRFEREAKLVSMLRDGSTTMMYDYGRTEDGLLFMVLEFIDGVTITELIGGEGKIESSRVVKILKQALSSLDEAHALGVLHRDIKPQNIMVYDHLGRTDRVKVLDFGIAKVVSDSAVQSTTELTADGILIGTPRYMSPEQIRGDDQLTAASDIYSLGLVAYEMLVGEKAISANSSMKIIARHLDPSPIVLPDLGDIPWGLRRIIDRMLQKDCRARYGSCAELISDLEEYERGGGAIEAEQAPAAVEKDARVGVVDSGETPSSAPGVEADEAFVAVSDGGLGLRVAAAMVGGVLVVGGLAYAMIGGEDASEPAPSVREVSVGSAPGPTSPPGGEKSSAGKETPLGVATDPVDDGSSAEDKAPVAVQESPKGPESTVPGTKEDEAGGEEEHSGKRGRRSKTSKPRTPKDTPRGSDSGGREKDSGSLSSAGKASNGTESSKKVVKKPPVVILPLD